MSNNPSNRQRLQQGFTLLELMIVVIVIAIIAALAIPNYGRYAYRARRGEGQELLMRIAQAQERYFTSYNKYTNSLADLGFSGGTATSERGYYKAELDLPSNTEFTASAIPQGAQAADVCGTLKLTSAGKKTPDSSDTSANSNGKCW